MQRFTAQVTGSGPSAPSGTVNFYDTTTSPPTLLGTANLDSQGRAVLLDSDLSVGSHPVQAVYGGDSQNQGNQSGLLNQAVLGCTVSAHLVHGGTTLLDLPGATLQVRVGRTMVTVGQAAVSYCADPGRATAQATLTGTISTGSGAFARGDSVSLHLRTSRVGHRAASLQAVLSDATSKHRLALLGPFDSGSRITIGLAGS